MADVTANNDTATTQAGQSVDVDVLANDTVDGAPATVGALVGPPVLLEGPDHGTASVDPETGVVTYTPEPGFCGTDTITYGIEVEEPAPFQFLAGEGELNLTLGPGVIVDWGDGTPPETTGEGITRHTYDDGGPYTGTITQFNLEERPYPQYPEANEPNGIAGTALLAVVDWGEGELPSQLAFSILDMFWEGLFAGSPNLTSVPPTSPPGVTNMAQMFAGMVRYNPAEGESQFNGDISGWDTSQVTNMSGMFLDAVSFNQDISGWDTSAVTNLNLMFCGAAAFSQDLSGWDTSAVTDMGHMFDGATSFNGDISGWGTSAVTDMRYMFYEAAVFNQDLSGWDVSNATIMRDMFHGAVAFNQDISAWDVRNNANFTGMFQDAASFNQDLSGWCVEHMGHVPGFFDEGATSWTLPRPNWGVPC